MVPTRYGRQAKLVNAKRRVSRLSRPIRKAEGDMTGLADHECVVTQNTWVLYGQAARAISTR